MHYEEKVFGRKFAHTFLGCLGRQVVGNGFGVNFHETVFVGSGIQNTALGIVVYDEVKELVELVFCDFLLKL